MVYVIALSCICSVMYCSVVQCIVLCCGGDVVLCCWCVCVELC